MVKKAKVAKVVRRDPDDVIFDLVYEQFRFRREQVDNEFYAALDAALELYKVAQEKASD